MSAWFSRPVAPSFDDLHRVVEGNVSTVVPALDAHWPKLAQLEWLARCVEVDTGRRVSVREADFRIGGRPQPGYFDLSTGRSVSGPYRFHEAWVWLNGFASAAGDTETPSALRIDAAAGGDGAPVGCLPPDPRPAAPQQTQEGGA